MAADLNQCNFTGRLGKDPEVKFTPNGTAVAALSLAVGGSKKEGEQWVDTVEWVPVVLFGRMAEISGEYLAKGSQVRITGRFTTRKWRDKTGQDRYRSEIVAVEMQMLGGKPDGDGRESRPSSPSANRRQKDFQAPPDGGAWGVGEDDIPF